MLQHRRDLVRGDSVQSWSAQQKQQGPEDLLVARSRFQSTWQSLPQLTVLAAAPGWGKSAWLKQCSEHLRADRDAVWVKTPAELRSLVETDAAGDAAARPPKLFLVDGLESYLAEDPALWGTVAALAETSAAKVIVAAHEPPGSDASTAEHLTVNVLDEQDLAFDQDEVERVADAVRSQTTSADVSTFGGRMRGCPWLVGREALRQSAGRSGRAWVTGEPNPEVVFYRELEESESFLESGIGRAFLALRALPIFTEASLRLLFPDLDAKQVFRRLASWPLFTVGVDDETGQRALLWTRPAWMAMTQEHPADRRVLQDALGVERDRESVVGQARTLLLMGDVDEAEQVVLKDFRRFLMFASGSLMEDQIPSSVDPAKHPALSLLNGELTTRGQGNTKNVKEAAGISALALAERTAQDLQGELNRASLAAYAAVSAGDRVLARRFLDHSLELAVPARGEVRHCPKETRRRVSGCLYLAYWAATQLDDHGAAGELADLLVEIADPLDRIAEMERVTQATQSDFAGSPSTKQTGDRSSTPALSHAASLRDLERGDDARALERFGPLLSLPGPLPSRSAFDGLVLLVRALAAPQDLREVDVREVVDRSKFLWGGKPSGFVAWAALVGCSTWGDVAASRVCGDLLEGGELEGAEPLTGLARLACLQGAGRHREAVGLTDVLLGQPLLPRFEVIVRVLRAASLVALDNRAPAYAALKAAWASHRDAGLLRFAFRLIPADVADALIRIAKQEDGDLNRAAQALADDPRPVKWERRAYLTSAEKETLELLQAGLTNAQIAAHRFVTVGTVRNQLKSLYRKLGVEGRDQAVAAGSDVSLGRRARL